MFSWQDFVRVLNKSSIEFEHLKIIQLSQAILESGRGESALFQRHANPYGMKYRREMHQIAVPMTYKASDGEDVYCKFDDLDDAVAGYWIFIDRPVYAGWRHSSATPEDYLRFIVYAGYVGGPFDGTQADRDSKEKYIEKIRHLIPEARRLLADQPVADVPLNPEHAAPIWRHKGVLLEVGHGPMPAGFDPGAVGVNGVREYDLNLIAARAAKAVIDAAGVPCVITDMNASLYAIGQLAAGYDVFCSIHHNSAGTAAQGAEALVHIDKGDASDVRLANLISAEIARELAIADRNRKNGTPRRALGVLSGAEDTNVRVSVLAELYFIHVAVPNPTEWSTRGGQATGRAILQWLKENTP